jgi:cytochrome c oxidase assembly factor CtaG
MFTRALLIPIISAIVFIALPQAVLAHTDEPPTPETIWGAWHWETPLTWVLIISAGLYVRGQRRFRRRVATSRSVERWRQALNWRAVSFFSGLGVLVVALISPIEAWGGALFAAHMGQHMLLVLVAAPLLVLGDPFPFLMMALPPKLRRGIGQWWNDVPLLRQVWHILTRPMVVWFLHVLALWAWHVPGLYEAALASEPVHILEHTSFFVTALLFWWSVLSPSRRELDKGMAVLYLFTMALQSGVLGFLITFASFPWYEAYSQTTAAWGLTPLEDQQLAGALMWIPAGVVYVGAAVVLFVLWLKEIERRADAAAL